MQRTLVRHIKEKIGEQIKINGWVQSIRDQGGIKFLQIRDVSGVVQAVVIESTTDLVTIVGGLSLESVVEIMGVVKEEKRARGGVEVEIKDIIVLSKAAPELPIPVIYKGGKEPSQPNRLDWRWIDLRRPEKLMIFKVWTELECGFRDFFEKEGYLQVYPPSFMSTPSESGSELFEVSYFEKKAYLAQSPQFYKQMAMASGFEKVFMFAPVFRAEPSFTTRHTTEFTGLDVEISYITSHYDLMEMEENLIVAGFQRVKNKLDLDISIPPTPFPKISMEKAKQKLREAAIRSEKEYDINPEEEREICRIIKEETGHDFVFITEYPVEARPFYHMRVGDAVSLTKSFDLLYKGVEITTGAQREHRYEILIEQAKEKEMDLESLEHYFNFFKYGCPPHGGIGAAPVRIVMKMLNLPNLREATFLPRDVNRLTP
ncbi:aspartate--tRNA(Asn) ligase [Patescibacteria group bacterium]|nr:aspartate--tRNA(Asn) ligase [Patescibacteria group bacterium]